MIITRTPFRVSLCGGGSDINTFYQKHGGCVLSTTINKYMYIALHPSFDKNTTILKYSKTERVNDINKIEHNIFRECLKREGIEGVEITSMADIPQGTGLGSSSSFTVGLIKNLKCYKREYISKEEIAAYACDIENNVVHTTNGKQDQYAAAFGGLNFYKFNADGTVDVEPVLMGYDAFKQLEKNLIMLYVGGEHKASEILEEQSKNIISAKEKEEGQKKIMEMTYDLKRELEHDNIDYVGEILDMNWKIKKTLASGISNTQFDEWYDKGIKAGALGGKLLGAGGSGFFLFYVPEKNQKEFREIMSELPELEFKFDHQGTTTIFVN